MSNNKEGRERIFKYVSEGVIPDGETESLDAKTEGLLAGLPSDFFKDNDFENGADPKWESLPRKQKVRLATMYNASRYAAAIAWSGGYME